MRLCTCCSRCIEHCLCDIDCFNAGAEFEEQDKICTDCKAPEDNIPYSLENMKNQGE